MKSKNQHHDIYQNVLNKQDIALFTNKTKIKLCHNT